MNRLNYKHVIGHTKSLKVNVKQQNVCVTHFDYRLWVMLWLTRILSKAEGVPPLCTWPKMVTLVSKPRQRTTSWAWKESVRWQQGQALNIRNAYNNVLSHFNCFTPEMTEHEIIQTYPSSCSAVQYRSPIRLHSILKRNNLQKTQK